MGKAIQVLILLTLITLLDGQRQSVVIFPDVNYEDFEQGIFCVSSAFKRQPINCALLAGPKQILKTLLETQSATSLAKRWNV
jgi:hypothetical protein